MIKKALSFALSVIFCLNFLAVGAFAAARDISFEESLADDLKQLGIFQGVSDSDFDLGRAPTRLEALIMLIRILGKEKEALSNSLPHPFTDVPSWADRYVGYAYQNKLASGVSQSEFGLGNASAVHYLTFMLRALGYSDGNGQDFTWDAPFSLANSIGIIPAGTNITDFWRADVVRVSYAGLAAKLKGSEQTLAQKLISAGVFSQDRFASVYREDAFAGSGGSAGEPLTARQISDKVSNAVFYIEVFTTDSDYQSGDAVSSGSGFLIAADGTAVTNYHVISDTLHAVATMTDGKKYPVERVVCYDIERDIAVLRLSRAALDGGSVQQFPFIAAAASDTVYNGDSVFAIGSPKGLQNTISDGIVSNAKRMLEGEKYPYIQTTAPISNGSSGGALLNSKGEAIGVTSAFIVDGQNLNLAVPMDWVMTQNLSAAGMPYADAYRTEFRKWLQLENYDFAEDPYYEEYPEELENFEPIYSGNTVIGTFQVYYNMDYYYFDVPIPVYLTAIGGAFAKADARGTAEQNAFARIAYQESWEELFYKSFGLTLDIVAGETYMQSEMRIDGGNHPYKIIDGVYLKPGRYYLCTFNAVDHEELWAGQNYFLFMHLDPA